MTKAQRAAKALELTKALSEVGRVGCACYSCVESRREFNRRLLTELLMPLMAEGGL